MIKKYVKFLKEGKREENLINVLLDKMEKGGLTTEEEDLLKRLSSGEQLPKEQYQIVYDKLGGYTFDAEGNVVTKKVGEESTDGSTRTSRGLTKGEQTKQIKLENARVYKEYKSEEKFYYLYGDKQEWIIYRTKGKGDMGTFMDMTKNSGLSKLTPEEMWKRNEQNYDMFMILNEDYVNYVLTYYELKNQSDNKETRRTKLDLYNKLNSLI